MLNYFFLILIISSIFFYLLNYSFKKNQIFIDKVKISEHKKFTKENNVPFTGGIFFLFAIFYLLESFNLVNFTILFLIFLLGVFSDLNITKSPVTRILIQSILILIYLVVNDLVVTNTRINIFDNILKNYKLISVLFTFFCVIVLINGTNFIDGVNNLASGYYFVVFLNLIFLTNITDINIEQYFLFQFLFFLGIFLIFNFFSQSFLGDNGSYLLGFFVGFYLIAFYINQESISPYYIILLLWYPAYENLFSIVRRLFFERKKVKKADNLHLHHLLFKFLSKFLGKNKFLNSLTGLLINFINLIIIFPSNFYASKTNILVGIIFIGLIVYNAAYLFFRFHNSKSNKINKY
tara:strand:- start:1051 stop:2100 length:1050 start_codon:yes stop_codon:yes gene_type:complete